MKADIPDSIIISRDEDGVLHHSYWTTEQQLIPFDDTEYIRKEALLKWAKERKRYYEDEILRWGLSDSSQATTFVSIASIKRLVYEVVIDKLNSM